MHARSRNIRARGTILAAAALATGLATAAATAGGDLYEIVWSSADNGAATSVGGPYQLTGTIGEPDASMATGDDGGTEYCLAGGYQPVGCIEEIDTCPADTNNDGVVDVGDLVNVVLDWGCTFDPCIGDVNGDGITDVQDLVLVIIEWGPCA